MISSDEKDTLLAWIEKIEDKFIPNNYTPYRKYYVFSNDNSCPYLLWDIRNRIIQKENLEKCVGEPYIGDYIGWISEGGSIHHHMDPGCNGLDRKKLNHIRYNFFLSLPKEGGLPIYNGEVKYPKEGEYLLCKSGTEYHSCTEVVGDKPRIVLSYGFLQ